MLRAGRAGLAAGVLLLAGALARAESHTVQPGENLYLIAKQHNVSINSIVRFNGITDQRLIRPGTVIEIPQAEPAAPETQPAGAAEPRAELSPQPNRTVVVQSQPTATAAFPAKPPHPHAAQSKPAARPKPAPEPAQPQPAPIASAAPREDPAPQDRTQADPPAVAPAATASPANPLLSLSLGAEPEAAKGQRPEPRTRIGAGMIADLVLKLGLVLVAAYASVWALKKFTQRRGRLLPARGSVRIVETTSLAPNRGLHLVAVGNRVFMIGSTPESISLLSEVSEVAEVAQRLEPKPEKASFGSQLQAMFRRAEPVQATAQAPVPSGAEGIGGVIASLRDGTFFMKRAAERAGQLSGRGSAVDSRG